VILPLRDVLWRLEHEALEGALAVPLTHKRRAKLLGISLRSYYYKIKEHGLGC
jgi:transcriptional regulator with PAS, ATPase and Fis domain